jgi:Peptidase S24-like
VDYIGVPLQSSVGTAQQIRALDQIYSSNGSLYVPFHSVPVAAGLFLSLSMDRVEKHLRLPPEYEFRHCVRDHYLNGLRTHRRHLAAARVQGDSMVDRGIEDGHVIVFQHSGFEYIEHNRILVVEKVGEEEGWGAWSLKRLIVEQARSSGLNEFGDEIDWEEPVFKLRSHNRRIGPWQLVDGTGQYSIRGVLLRSLHPEDVHLMESESLQHLVADERSFRSEFNQDAITIPDESWL